QRQASTGGHSGRLDCPAKIGGVFSSQCVERPYRGRLSWRPRHVSEPLGCHDVDKEAHTATPQNADHITSNTFLIRSAPPVSAKQRCSAVSCTAGPADAGWRSTPGFSSMTSAASRDGLPVGRLIKLMFVLWLAGVAMRMTILAMPPIIPQVHDELHMSETQVGLLIGLPLALFAVAAVPGSLLIARIGTGLAVIIGMVIAALASGARAAAVDVATLYVASIATGFGVAIMQPAMPTLVRAWLPRHIALGTIAYTSGM